MLLFQKFVKPKKERCMFVSIPSSHILCLKFKVYFATMNYLFHYFILEFSKYLQTILHYCVLSFPVVSSCSHPVGDSYGRRAMYWVQFGTGGHHYRVGLPIVKRHILVFVSSIFGETPPGPSGIKIFNPGIFGMGFCQIPGSRNFWDGIYPYFKSRDC